MVENPPSNAGDAVSVPGWGTKIPHAVEQLSLCTTATEPTSPGARTPQLEREKRNLHATTRERKKKPARHN